MNITIVAKRWFDNDGCANTYHSSTTLINGEIVDSVEMEHGGDNDQYRFTAFKSLFEKGILKKYGLEEPVKYSHGGLEQVWRWAERVGVKMNYFVSDVANKSDL